MEGELLQQVVDQAGAGAGRVHVRTGAGLIDHLLEQLAFHAGYDVLLEGSGDLETGAHHTAEAAFKAVGRALRAAVRAEGGGIRSTKGLT